MLVSEPVVTTSLGMLRGTQLEGVQRFLGIPYGSPPVGALRLRPPQPVAPWSGVRDARQYGPIAPQYAEPRGEEASSAGCELDGALVDVPQDEDCLTLNIWTPAR